MLDSPETLVASDAEQLCADVAARPGVRRVSVWVGDADQAEWHLYASWPRDGGVGPLPEAGHGPTVGPSQQPHPEPYGYGWTVRAAGGDVHMLVTGDVTLRPPPREVVTAVAASVLDALPAAASRVAGDGRLESLDDAVLAVLAEPGRSDELDRSLSRLRDGMADGDVEASLLVEVDGLVVPLPFPGHGARPPYPTCHAGHTDLAVTVSAAGRPVTRVCRPAPAGESWACPMACRLLGVPLDRGGRRLGVLVVGFHSGTPVRAEATALVVETASLAAATVERAMDIADQRHRLAVTNAQRTLLEAGVRSCSVLEAAESIARTVADFLDMPVACTYLVDRSARITELASVGATPEQHEELRSRLIGRLGSGSPVWQRSIEVPRPGPYFLDDTSAPDSIRPGGMAEILGYRCLATVPLLASDGPIGVVVCGDPRGPRRWRSSERDLVLEIAMQATVVLDNARLREAERHQATHDALTGLLNRAGLHDRLRQEVARATRHRHPLALLILDLNRFKEINDSLGHATGDVLLAEVARRLEAVLREGDVVARLGGDEFAFLLPETDVQGATSAAARIEASLTDPVRLAGRLVQVGSSIGIAVHPHSAGGAEDLLRTADAAMYVAKRNALPYSVYEASNDEDGSHHRLGQTLLLGDLGRALAQDELVLHYQPQVDARSGRLVGAEALIRWQHPQRGLLYPPDFVPVTERSGLIRRLTAWVVPRALRQCHRWLDQGLDVGVAVNVSAHDTTDPDFVDRVIDALEATGVPPGHLVVELTETALLLDPAAGLRTLARLRDAGVRCSLDDFGTGHSALSYLSTLPVDELKIDRSFFGAGLDERSYLVLKSILELGHRLGMTVVAEGVEDAGLADHLRDLGCDVVQGYLVGRPMDVQAFAAWVDARTADPVSPVQVAAAGRPGPRSR